MCCLDLLLELTKEVQLDYNYIEKVEAFIQSTFNHGD